MRMLFSQCCAPLSKRSLGIYNISPSLDFDREPMHDEMIVSRSPSDRVVIPTIQVDRNYNPFREETTTPKPQEIVSLTEMYQTSVSPSPSKSTYLMKMIQKMS